MQVENIDMRLWEITKYSYSDKKIGKNRFSAWQCILVAIFDDSMNHESS